MTQERLRRPASTDRAAESSEAPTAPAPHAAENGDRLKAELDDLLDEIDDVLEHNVVGAAEFVASYVQAGGQ